MSIYLKHPGWVPINLCVVGINLCLDGGLAMLKFIGKEMFNIGIGLKVMNVSNGI